MCVCLYVCIHTSLALISQMNFKLITILDTIVVDN